MKINIDFVRDTEGSHSHWGFIIKGNSSKISGEYSDFLCIIEHLFEINENFFVPTTIKTSVISYPQDGPVNEFVLFLYPDKIKDGSAIPIKIESEAGISFHDFLDGLTKIEPTGDAIKYIWELEMRGKVNYNLNGKDIYIDKKSSKDVYAVCDESGVILDKPTSDPMWIRVEQSDLKGPNIDVAITDPAYFDITYWTETNIWFESTDTGRANRDRLDIVLKKLRETFNVVYETSEREC